MNYPRIIRLKETTDTPIPNTGRVERMLKLIKYLREWRTAYDCAELLDISYKSVHRYLNLLVKLGFEIETGFAKRHTYRIRNLRDFFDN